MRKLNWKIKGIKLPDNWKWLKRLDFYIIKKFLGTYVFAIALIISIAVVFDFNEKMDKFMSHEAPWKAIVFDYYLNFVPYFANLFSPLFVFIFWIKKQRCLHYLCLTGVYCKFLAKDSPRPQSIFSQTSIQRNCLLSIIV